MVDIVVSMAAYFCFRPLSWGLSFNWLKRPPVASRRPLVFVPFLGDFLSIQKKGFTLIVRVQCFRPLSWGLSFNDNEPTACVLKGRYRFRPLSWGLSFNLKSLSRFVNMTGLVFVPFLGDFLSIWVNLVNSLDSLVFVPFLGDFLSIWDSKEVLWLDAVFVPFLGDFLSIVTGKGRCYYGYYRFRPLSWGLSFNWMMGVRDAISVSKVFVPFLGDFLSIGCIHRPRA